eukprot:TRINITY_DN5298_c0_g1_i4.p1 TRINITY_DN5298_c0_g1~~TRINITY_DN5298_c0_g1_i4.p1  ORF type:complete len:3089 (+),score=731.08 TRINITY_DN5298_c0_g1_i4:933-9269(+)
MTPRPLSAASSQQTLNTLPSSGSSSGLTTPTTPAKKGLFSRLKSIVTRNKDGKLDRNASGQTPDDATLFFEDDSGFGDDTGRRESFDLSESGTDSTLDTAQTHPQTTTPTPALSVRQDESPFIEDYAELCDPHEVEILNEQRDFVFTENEDIKYSAYNISVASFALSLKDADSEPFAHILLSNLRLSFFPKGTSSMPSPLYNESVLQLSIFNVSIEQRNTGPDKHPLFLHTLRRLAAPGTDKEDLIRIRYIRRKPKQRPGTRTPAGAASPATLLQFFRRDADVRILPIEIVFDRDFVKRVHLFLFGGPKGRLELKMEESMEKMLEDALCNLVKFRIDVGGGAVVFPPFAGHTGPPEIASQVFRLSFGHLLFVSGQFEAAASARPMTPTPSGETVSNSKSIFSNFKHPALIPGGDSCVFPSRVEDITSQQLPAPSFAQKFQIQLKQMRVEMQLTPISPAVTILQPVVADVQVSFPDWFGISPDIVSGFVLPTATVTIAISELNSSMMPLQYRYLLSVMEQRVSWSKKSAVVTDTATAATTAAAPAASEDAFIWVASMKIEKLVLNLCDASDSDAQTLDSHVLARLTFANFCLVSESNRAMLSHKVACASFEIQCPQHKQSPFFLLLSGNNEDTAEKVEHQLLLRYEKDKQARSAAEKAQKAEKRIFAEISQSQICLILQTLARLQLFFKNEPQSTDSEKLPALLLARQTVERFTTWRLQKAQEQSLTQWDVLFRECAFLVVETPETPECVQMRIHALKAKQLGGSGAINATFEAERANLATLMWDGERFSSTLLCEPFGFFVSYDRQVSETEKQTSISLRIEQISFRVSREQFVLLLNVAENTLASLRDVDNLYLAQQPQTLPHLKKHLVSIAKASVGLTFENNSQASTFVETVFYGFVYELNRDHQKIAKTLRVQSVLVQDTDTSNGRTPPFKIIFQPKAPPQKQAGADRRSFSRTMASGLGLTSVFSDPDTPLFKITQEQPVDPDAAPPEPARRDPDTGMPSLTGVAVQRWVVEVQPAVLVYSPEFDRNVRSFFSLLSSQQLLRKRYRRAVRELRGAFGEGVFSNETLRRELYVAVFSRTAQAPGGPDLAPSASPVRGTASVSNVPEPKKAADEPKSATNRLPIVFKIVFTEPSIILPDRLSSTFSSVLEMRAEVALATNENLSVYDTSIRRTDYFLTRAQISLDTIESATLGIVQSLPLVFPLDLQSSIVFKDASFGSGRKYCAIDVSADTVRAVLSLKKYKTMMAIVSRLFARAFTTKPQPGEPESAPAPAAPAPPVSAEPAPGEENEGVEFSLRLNLAHVDLTLVSDYVEELELFFFFLKDVDVGFMHGPDASDLTAQFRLELLSNNVNFNTAEAFLDPVLLTVEVSKRSISAHSLDHAPGAPEAQVQAAIHGLDRAKIHVSKELLRHMSETYQMFRWEGSNDIVVAVPPPISSASPSESGSVAPSSDMRSHFHYIVCNYTETALTFGQTGTPEKSRVKSGGRVAFSFSNPYLARCIDAELDGGWVMTAPCSVVQTGQQTVIFRDNAASAASPGGVLNLFRTKSDEEMQRTVFVVIKSQGLKKLIQFWSSHVLHNATQEHLTFRCEGRYDSLEVVTVPGQSVPICYNELWTDLRFFVRFSDDSTWSDPFVISFKRFETVKTLSMTTGESEKILYMNLLMRDDVTKLCSVTFTPPFTLNNASVSPLFYLFGSATHTQGGLVPQNSKKSFFFNLQRMASLSLALPGYKNWSRPISLQNVRMSSVVLQTSQSAPGQQLEGFSVKDSVVMRVSITAPPQNRIARTMTVVSPFVFANESDLFLAILQRGRTEHVILRPHETVPFSWETVGARQILIRVGTDTWSEPLNIWLATVHLLDIPMPDIDTNYRLAMSISESPVDNQSRLVRFTPTLKFTNDTNLDLTVHIGRQSLRLGPFSNASTALYSSIVSFLVAGSENSLHTAPMQAITALTTEEATFSGTFQCQQGNIADTSLAVDVLVKLDRMGTAVTLAPCRFPPYILRNMLSVPLRICQTGVREAENPFILAPSASHTFFFPSQTDARIIQVAVPTTPETAKTIESPTFSVQSPGQKRYESAPSSPHPFKAVKSEGLAMQTFSLSPKGGYYDDMLWTEGLSLEQLGNFPIVFGRTDVDTAGQRLSQRESTYMSSVINTLSNKPSGIISALLGTDGIEVQISSKANAKIVTFALPVVPGAGAGAIAETQENQRQFATLRLALRFPSVHIRLLNENQEETVYVTADGLSVSHTATTVSAVTHFALRNAQIDNMLPDAEYSVIFSANKRQLFERNANLIELLHERTFNPDMLITQYAGLRVLPLNIRIDGQLIEALTDLLEYVRQQRSKKPERPDQLVDVEAEDAEGAGESSADGADNSSAAAATPPTTTQTGSTNTTTPRYIEELVVFSVDITLCIGDNSFGLPVIRDGIPLTLSEFRRNNVFDQNGSVVRNLARTYFRLGWSELTTIVGSLDMIGSPLGALRLVSSGLRDMVQYPWTGLVDDDTPGAFLVGVVQGSSSLLFSVSTAFFNSSTKVLRSLSDLSLLLALDDLFAEEKKRRRRHHPATIWAGVADGSVEMAWSLGSAVSGLVGQPVRGVQNDGVLGLPVGLAKGIWGVPTKSINGVIDLMLKTLEGVKGSTGSDLIVQARVHQPELKDEISAIELARLQNYVFERDERWLCHWVVTVLTKRGRTRRRILVLSASAVHVLNPLELQLDDDNIYEPTSLWFSLLSKVVVPAVPNTKVIFCVKRPVRGKEEVRVLVPNRDEMIERLSAQHELNRGAALLVERV